MTTALRPLHDAIAGRLPAESALLPAVRLQGFGGSAFGPEAVRALFRRAALASPARADSLQSPSAGVVADGCIAIWADLFEGRIGRLWVVGGPARADAAPARVDVPFDPDLEQRRGRCLYAADDHPDLAPDHAALVPRVADDLLDRLDAAPGEGVAGLPRAFRRRAFVLRAFSAGPRGAMLCAVTSWLDASRRLMDTMHTVTLFRASGGNLAHCRHFVERAVAGTWTPRV